MFSLPRRDLRFFLSTLFFRAHLLFIVRIGMGSWGLTAATWTGDTKSLPCSQGTRVMLAGEVLHTVHYSMSLFMVLVVEGVK